MEAVLVLPRAEEVTCVALSETSLCIASGSLASTYGRGALRCSWTDRLVTACAISDACIFF